MSQLDCGCALCKDRRDFKFPIHLVQEVKAGNVVIFAGAGISTENRSHSVDTLYERLAHELKTTENLTFPELCQQYCAQPDGRIKLIQQIKDRFDYFRSFSDFYTPMTRFHHVLSPLYMISEVITTNWDDFFELEAGFDAFVADSDLPFWNASKRRLLKIHGSIRNLGSIVATSSDYEEAFRRLNEGPLGAMLKTLMFQKTIVYVGYSLSDENYVSLAENITKMLRPHVKTSYIVSPNISDAKIGKFPLPLTPIETDGSYFLEQLRLHIEDDCEIAKDSAFNHCHDLLHEAVDAHEEASGEYFKSKRAFLPFTLSYQDGLIHGLQRIRDRRATGEYHNKHHVHHLVNGYLEKAAHFASKGDLWNESYANGYRDALMYFILVDDKENHPKPPLFGAYEWKGFRSLLSLKRFSDAKISKKHLLQSKRIYKQCCSGGQMLIPDHTPYL